MATQIQIRRDTSTNWTANDPTLSEGEVAYETDTQKLKVGDGVTAWTLLPYFTGSGGVTDVLGGAGLTASGTGVVTLDVGAGTGITVNADDIAVDMTAFSTTNLSEGTNLYHTAARVDAEIADYSGSINTAGDITAATLNGALPVSELGTPAFNTIQKTLDVFLSTGLVSGGIITDAGAGTIDVSAGEGFIRATSDITSTLYATDFAAATGVALTDNDLNYVYVVYNAGTPTVAVSVIEPVNTSEYIKLGTVYREGTTLHITGESAYYVGNHASNMITRLQNIMPFAHASGGVLTEAATRNIAVSAGTYWEGLNEFTLAAFDSTTADTFDLFYRDGVGGWTKTVSQSQLGNTQYDDGSGTLATLNNNQYGVYWVYEDREREVAVLYGEGSYTLTEAQLASPPSSTPAYFERHSILVGRIIVLKDATNFTEVDSAFTRVFSASTVSNHNDLGALQGGAADDYNHLTTAQVALVDNSLQPGDAYVEGTELSLVKFNETLVAAGNTGGALSFDMSTGSIHTATLTSDVTSLALTNAATGASATIILTQDGTGNRTLTAGASWKWAGGTNTLSTAANAVDIISVVWDGTTYWASLTTAYA